MKFNGQTGQFNCGQEEKRPVPLGACFTVAYDGIMLGWSLWQDKKITNQVIGLAIEGFPMPSRESLEPTFLDRTQWVTRLGKPQDPWQKTYYIPMMGKNGEIYTYTASSESGIFAAAGLTREIGMQRRHHPECYPVIELNKGFFRPSDPDAPVTPKPVMRIVAWQPKQIFRDAYAKHEASGGHSDQETEGVSRSGSFRMDGAESYAAASQSLGRPTQRVASGFKLDGGAPTLTPAEPPPLPPPQRPSHALSDQDVGEPPAYLSEVPPYAEIPEQFRR
jgi:hypothetical protein